MGIEARSANPEPAVFRTVFGFQICMILLFGVNFVAVTLASEVPVVVPYLGVSFLGLVQASCAAAAIITFYFMLSTKYRVVDGVLHMHYGLFSRRIELESTSRIRLKGKMFRGTLIGLGARGVFMYCNLGVSRVRVVRVTPKDVDGFLAAIGARRTESGDVETGVPDRQRCET